MKGNRTPQAFKENYLQNTTKLGIPSHSNIRLDQASPQNCRGGEGGSRPVPALRSKGRKASGAHGLRRKLGLRGRARRGGGDPRQTKRLSPLHFGDFGAPSDPVGRAGRGASAPPLPPPAPSPTLTLQQPLDDAVDVELVYIRHRLSAAGRSPPRRSARGLAGPTPLLVLFRFCPFLLCAFPRALCPPAPSAQSQK